MKNCTTGTKYHGILLIFGFVLTAFSLEGCKDESPETVYPEVNRLDKLPSDISKRGPDTDLYPPVLHSNEYEEPIPLAEEINTSGGEDSPFILPDGNTLYFFFTPDVR